MRAVEYVGVWPVAFAKRTRFEGPVCVNGSVVEWHKNQIEMAPNGPSRLASPLI